MVLSDKYKRPEIPEIDDFLRIFQISQAMLNSHNDSSILKSMIRLNRVPIIH